VDQEVSKSRGWPFSKAEWSPVAESQIKHLIEIAVVQKAVPRDADQMSAHEAIKSAGIESGSEQFQVSVKIFFSL